MRILAFDTVGPVIGVGAGSPKGERVRTERITRKAESRLLPWAQDLARELGFEPSQIDGVGVAIGPGAFTGLRVGVATACGLAQAVGCPVWGACSLRTRATPHLGSGRPVLSLLDARKGRVYAAIFDSDGQVRVPPADVEPAVALSWSSPGMMAVGEGAIVYRERVEAAGLVLVEPADDPGVTALLRLARSGLDRDEGVSPTELRPVYLRAPDAKPPAGR
ncbi:MAG: tRNA (adenosine(37)-N6)-threonylcarbamoyltransferase complex dimerization subunit type 1 TsaB [Deltaproteobacteria bacterium]|nr:MAG: tRNA (adenosine(37)-N6)-threonylcarbamoyltransferase complex dimerization subunit type 1 TsaB [Deltaproteobacteria bacterium]